MTRQRLITSYLVLTGLLGLSILLSLSMGYARSSFLDVIDLILGTIQLCHDLYHDDHPFAKNYRLSLWRRFSCYFWHVVADTD